MVNANFGSSAVNLSVTAAGAGSATPTPTVTFQWYSNTTASNAGGTPIPGATSAVFTTPNNLAVGNHFFFARATNCGGTVASQPFTVNVRNLLEIPTFTGSGSLTGISCFDIAYSNPGGNCGDLTGRTPSRRNFATHQTEVYTFTATGSIENLTFDFANLQATPVIQSISSTGTGTGATVTVTFNPNLNTLAQGLDRDNALRATIHALFNVPGQATVRLSLTITVADCNCCPGLLIPGGAFSHRAGNIATLPAGSTTNTNSNTAAGPITAVISSFTRSGRDLCIYYRDFSNTANANTSSLITWNAATNNGNISAAGIGGVCGLADGRGVDQIHAHPEWRLPNIAELAQIGQLVSTQTHGNTHTSVMTQDMVNARITAAADNGQLPAGSAITTHMQTFNLRQTKYWSSTRQSAISAWHWVYVQTDRRANANIVGNFNYVRCVRSF